MNPWALILVPQSLVSVPTWYSECLNWPVIAGQLSDGLDPETWLWRTRVLGLSLLGEMLLFAWVRLRFPFTVRRMNFGVFLRYKPFDNLKV